MSGGVIVTHYTFHYIFKPNIHFPYFVLRVKDSSKVYTIDPGKDSDFNGSFNDVLHSDVS